MVPQGYGIGPILLVIDINNMPNHLSTANLIYDDDVELIVPRNRHEILKSYLHLSVSWPIEGVCPETILCEPTYFSPLIQIFYPATS